MHSAVSLTDSPLLYNIQYTVLYFATEISHDGSPIYCTTTILLYTVYCILQQRYLRMAAQYTTTILLYTVYCTLYIVYCILQQRDLRMAAQYTVQYPQYDCILYTVQYIGGGSCKGIGWLYSYVF